MRTWLRILGYLRPYRKDVLAAYAALLGSTALFLALPFLIGESIDRIVEADDRDVLVVIGALLLSVAVLRGIFAYFETYLREKLAQLVAYDMRNQIFVHLQRLSFAYHDRQQTGQLMSRATADVEGIRWFINLGVVRMSYLVLLVIGASVLLLTIDWLLALMCLSFVPFIIVRGWSISRTLRGIWTRAQEYMGELGMLLQESLSGVKVVKVFTAEGREEAKFAAKAQDLADENLAAVRVQATNAPVLVFTFTGLTVLILWFGGHRVIDGVMSPGDLTKFILYMAMLQMPVRMSGFLLNLQSRAISSGERIFEILDADSPVKDEPGAVDLNGARGRVVMDKVAFGYSAASPVLEEISFEAEPGEIVALLGKTGSGKSTIVHLIPRFYDATSGAVTIDGQDVRDLTLESLRGSIGIVQQDVFLFSDTIEGNIAYGVPGANRERVEWAAKIANIHEFILSLPNGYDTWVGERGITLSGGQKQRIAIARTLLIDPRILILDDSTSSVDTRTEFEIRRALERLIKGRTTFVIAQRLSTVKSADQILVLDRGRIVQRGTHEDLVEEEDGIYREIYDMQLRAQEEAGRPVADGEAAP